MEINLLEETTENLLEKFGAGNHKPGSGSAAAFQGMLTAKLLITVIALTCEPKRNERYKTILPKIEKYSIDIQNRIFPELTSLFHEDAIQFGKTIEARKERDKEPDIFKQNKLSRKALEELKISIDLPLKIAYLCIELSEIAEFVFDNCFQSARGDSQVALSGAVAGLGGCLAIINLNLLSFEHDDYKWVAEISKKSDELKNRYNQLNEISTSKVQLLEDEVKAKGLFYENINNMLKQNKSKSELNDSDIKKIASDLQNYLWQNRSNIWKKELPKFPIQILKPSIIFKRVLGYTFETIDGIGITEKENSYSEIAGIIDQNEKIVLLSENYDKFTLNFTAAHELGHALLHNQTVMHRDRPLNGNLIDNNKRDYKEIQADKFATYFLMPEKLVKQVFRKIFTVEKLYLNELTAFNMNTTPTNLRQECKDLRDFSLKIATAEIYASKSFSSISKIFHVSPTAMAIRLEELDLIEL